MRRSCRRRGGRPTRRAPGGREPCRDGRRGRRGARSPAVAQLETLKLVDKPAPVVADADSADRSAHGRRRGAVPLEQRAAVWQSAYPAGGRPQGRRRRGGFCVVGGTEETIDNESRELDPAASGGFTWRSTTRASRSIAAASIPRTLPRHGHELRHGRRLQGAQRARDAHRPDDARARRLEGARAPARLCRSASTCARPGSTWSQCSSAEIRARTTSRATRRSLQHFPELQELSADYAANFKFGVPEARAAIRGSGGRRWCRQRRRRASCRSRAPRSRRSTSGSSTRDAARPVAALGQGAARTPAGGSTEKARRRSEWDYYRHVQTHPILQSAKTPLPPEFAQPLWAEFALHIKSVKDADSRGRHRARADCLRRRRGGPPRRAGRGTRSARRFDDTFRTLEIDDVEAVTVSNNRPCLLWTTEAAAVENGKQAASQPARTVNRYSRTAATPTSR